MENTLAVSNLKKYFGAIKAVDDISFTVNKGEVLGFLGPNGAGKTTTMRMLTGFLLPDSGTANICGYNILQQPYLAKEKMGYIPENNPLYNEMTVYDFLSFITEVRAIKRRQRRDVIQNVARTAAIDNVLNRRIETLSKGYRSRVGLAQALLDDPEVLIMDEPTEGLDPNQKYDVHQLIKKISQDKIIVISTHILAEVEAMCTRVIIISEGKIVADDTPDGLKARSQTERLEDVFRELTLGKVENPKH